MKLPLTLVTYLWNGEKFGFPYREMISEALKLCSEVIVSCPEGDDDTVEQLMHWGRVAPIRVVRFPRAEGSQEFSTYINRAIEYATQDYVIQLDCDEVLEFDRDVELVFAPLSPQREGLNDGKVLAFPRWDFTCSASHITPIFREEPAIARLFARKHYPSICSSSDAMHLLGQNTETIVLDRCPVFHYHGLTSEGGWQVKEIEFQKLYADQGLQVDDRLALGWEAWATNKDNPQDCPIARKRKLTRAHPTVMLPWLSRAAMYLRDPFLEK